MTGRLIRAWLPAAAALTLALGCGGRGSDTAHRGEPGGPARVRFVDATERVGLGGFRQVNGSAAKPYILESFGAGVALFDVDGDGDLDVYLTNARALPDPAGDGEDRTPAYQATDKAATEDASGPPRDALYLNDGEGNFSDVTLARGLGDQGWTTGVEVADVDGDGRIDLFLTGYRAQALLMQRADGTFEDATARAGLASDRWSTGACFLDFDHDGDLDLYVANHIELDLAALQASDAREEWYGERVYTGPRGLVAAPDRFYRNRGDGTFEDRSSAVGVDAIARYAFEAVAFDADGDGWVDVYVANDTQPNVLWRNVEGARFEEIALRSGAALSANGAAQAGMGVAVGDVDGDGVADLGVTNFSEDSSTLYLGRGATGFDDMTARARLIAPTRPYLGWSLGFDDLDLDGDVDLWCVNGHVFPQADRIATGMGYAQVNQAFLNDGDGRFRSAEDLGGGFDVKAASRGGAAGDLDRDGDIDLVIGNLDGPPTVLLNETARLGRAAFVRLVDRAPNTTAHGAVVTARIGKERRTRFVGTGSGFLSCSGSDVHFGLGAAARIDALEVRWADGEREVYPGVEAGFHVVLDRTLGIVRRWPLGTPQ
ncbi:MAG: CRTAC1 family protein [Planctomycetota bacterium]